MDRRSALKTLAAIGAGIPLHNASAAAQATIGPACGGAPAACCPIVELRHYTLHANRRDVFIDLFEREFVESQEAAGIKLIGHYRDLDDPTAFVWLRGFPDMDSRRKSLETFYHGAHWRSLRDSANASIVDNDNVLLLRPAFEGSGFAIDGLARPAVGAPRASSMLAATIYYLDPATADTFAEFFRSVVQPALAAGGINVLASFVREHSVNTFPGLPVRESDEVFVWFAMFDSEATAAQRADALARSTAFTDVAEKLRVRLKFRAPERLRLAPAARALLRA